MASCPLSSPFDHLSDDLVVRILEKVATWSLQDPFHSVRSFLRATGSCRRMRKLGHYVKEVDWALNTIPRAASFVNFIQHEAVSLSTLRLFVSRRRLGKLPLELIFTNAVRRKLPATIHVACYDEDGPFYAGENVNDILGNEPLLDVSELVKALLRNSQLTELQISASFCDFTIMHTFPSRPLPPLKVLILTEISLIETGSLKRLITDCSLLEHLEVSNVLKEEDLDQHFSTLEIVSRSLKSVVVSRVNVKVVAPQLLKLQARVGKLTIFGPALQELSMDARWKVALNIHGPKTGTQLRQLRLEHIKGSGNWWPNISKIVSKFSASLEVLELSCRHGLDKEGLIELRAVLLEEFLESLPPKLETLCMEGGFLELVIGGHNIQPHKCQVSCSLRALKVELKGLDASYLRLRLLVRALPMLEVLEISLPKSPDKDIAMLIQDDFAKVARVVLKQL